MEDSKHSELKCVVKCKSFTEFRDTYNLMIQRIKKILGGKNFILNNNKLTKQTEVQLTRIRDKYELERKDEKAKKDRVLIRGKKDGIDISINILLHKKGNGFRFLFVDYSGRIPNILTINITNKMLTVKQDLREKRRFLLSIRCKHDIPIEKFLKLLSSRDESSFEKNKNEINTFYFVEEHKKELLESIYTALFGTLSNNSKQSTTETKLKQAIEIEVNNRWNTSKMYNLFEKNNEEFIEKIIEIRTDIVDKYANEQKPTSSSKKTSSKKSSSTKGLDYD